MPLVDENAKVILDVGCGMGRLGAKLKQDVPGRQVFGIEQNKLAARNAKKVLDGVLTGDVQSSRLPFKPSMFDCMIFADVLEHVVDPGAVLQRLKRFLKKDGSIICSIPNMRHYTVLLKLITQGWQYEEYGLFDHTHLRFFSLATMKKMLVDEGFRTEYIEPRIVASMKMKFLNRMLLGKLEEFLAFQYLIKARNSTSR